MGKLFFASFVMLFAETMAIRWLGIEIPVIRAFPNLILKKAQSILGYRVLGIVGGARAVDAFVPGVFADR